MKNKKCICKRYNEGYINLKCPIHTGVPKIDPKWIVKNPSTVNRTIQFTNNFYGKVSEEMDK